MSKIEVNQISSQCGSTLTIGQSGDTVTLACGATQTGFGRTGTVDWDTTAKVNTDSPVTAVSGTGYFLNTTSGAITVNLPAGSAGSIVSLKDYANTWNTNAVTVAPNGTDKINGVNDNAVLNTQDQSVTLVYVDSTKGWRAVQDSTSDVTGADFITATGGTVSCCGDYKIHTFTGPGTFTVTNAGNAAGSNTVDYLVVAGGGGAGGSSGNTYGGGGGGGFRATSTTYSIGCAPGAPLTACVSAFTVTATGYPITVGGGGAGNCSGGVSGSNSIFSTITSAGGGRPYQSGGSGGGANGGSFDNPGGTGNTPPVSPPQGQPGGASSSPAGPDHASGGGGGAISAGTQGRTPSPTASGNGGAGAGLPSAFGTSGENCGSYYYFGGGGGGAGAAPIPLTAGTGGIGGGGDGSQSTGGPGTANTGGGGGGGGGPTPGVQGGSGGSGIVIIRYKYQ